MGMAASTNLFDVLERIARCLAHLYSGRWVKGKDDVAVLSYGFGRSTSAANRSVVGKTFALDSQAITVIGVMPQGFDFFVKENALSKRPRSSGCRWFFRRTRANALGDF